MNFIIRDATPKDSGKLLELTALTPMKGTIGLRIDRQPDFFSLLRLSESFILLVAENNSQEITGCFAATKSYISVDDKVIAAFHLRDLKIHPEYSGSMLAYLLVKKMHERLLKEDADILCAAMAAGNKAVIPFFAGRAGIPAFTEAANFNVYQILPKHNPRLTDNKTTTGKCALAEFFNICFKTFSLKPAALGTAELDNCVNFSFVKNNTVEAAITAFDPFPYRQNIVTSYSISIAAILTVLRFIKLFFHLPALPKQNIPLKIIYARYYACIKDKEPALKHLIEQLRNYAFKKNYHFVAVAADEKAFDINKLLKPISRFTFKSTLLVTSLQKNEDVINRIKQGLCYEDYSLV